MDLKWLLVRRITLVALACFLAGSAIALYGTAREIEAAERRPGGTRRPPAQSAALAHRPIDRRGDTLSRLEHGRGALSALRPVHRISRCVCRRAANELRGVDAAQPSPPTWFFAAYRSLINDRLTAARDISYRGTAYGAGVATSDPVATAGERGRRLRPCSGCRRRSSRRSA